MTEMELYRQSMNFLDEHQDLLALEYRLIVKKLKDLNTDLKELFIPTRLEMIRKQKFLDSKYLLVSVPNEVCVELKIECEFKKDRHEIIVRSEDFDSVFEKASKILILEMLEPLKSTKIDRRKYDKSVALNKSKKMDFQKIGELDEFLESQIVAFIESKDREYFRNHMIKDVRHEFIRFATEMVGKASYMNRNPKNARLTELVNERFGLIPVKFRIENSEEFDLFKGDNRQIGKYADFYMEDV